MTELQRIGLFGGTFDPVHRGHLAVAAAAREAAALDRVVFLPALRSPHKPGVAPGACGADRLAMLELATAGLTWAVASDWELTREPPSYSWKTAEHFQREHPGAALAWILGADQWAAIEAWAEPERMRALVEFIIYPRAGSPAPMPRAGWRSMVVDGLHPAAATEVRAALARGDAGHADLPDAVARYIRDKGLYR